MKSLSIFLQSVLRHLGGYWFISCLLFACQPNPDEFSGSLILQVSQDTLSLNTLFSTLKSPTYQLKIYNPSQTKLVIDQITLLNPNSSGIEINVDGMKGDEFKNLEIAKKDSLYIFVQATPELTGKVSPQLVRDYIRFEYLGKIQEIVLEYHVQDATFWHGKTIMQDTTITSDAAILIYDSLKVDKTSTLTLQAGTSLFFQKDAQLIVDGTLLAQGSLEKPVRLQGARRDWLFENLKYEDTPGQWGGIIIRGKSHHNQISYTEMKGASFGIQVESSSTSEPVLHIENSSFRSNQKDLLSLRHTHAEISNSEFSLAGGALAKITGGKVSFTHCTFANVYPFGVNTAPAIQIEEATLAESLFLNCIIWGEYETEIQIMDNMLPHTCFDHCLIKAQGEDDAQFIQTQWNKDPHFKTVDKEQYRFDWRIQEESEARAKGNPNTLLSHPFDRLGTPRTASQIDLGAYQYQH